jgi:hypothetical protein
MAALSLRAYARHRGVSLAAVQKAIQTGRIQTTAEGRIDVAQADQEWERNTHYGTTPATGDGAVSGPSYAQSRAIREAYLARLAKIEYEERTGKLISRDEVQVAAFNRFRVFRDNMLNIPDRMAAMLAAESDARKVHELLTGEIRKALHEFADGTVG